MINIRQTAFILLLYAFTFCAGCMHREVFCSETRVIHECKDIPENVCYTIVQDLDALQHDLKTIEQVLRVPFEPKVYKALNLSKQSVISKNYEDAIVFYKKAIEFARVYLVDNATLAPFWQALVNLETRVDGNSSSEETWADLMGLAVKQRLQRVVIPEFKIGPPKTLIDAIDYLKQASRDYDDPQTPIDCRGVSFVLKLDTNSGGDQLTGESEDPFTAIPSREAPVMPKLSARYISLYDAINLVCEVTGFAFNMRGGFIMITPREPDETKKQTK